MKKTQQQHNQVLASLYLAFVIIQLPIMEKTADEPRALSMSLDDIIKENRHKDGRSSQHRNNRGGAHFVANKSGGKQSYNSYNKGEKFVQPNRSVRVHYTWETAGGVETMSARVDDKELVRISSSGDVALRSAVEHDWAVFTPMNTVLAPVQLKLFFDKDIKKEWTVKNEAGWNRILDNDV